MGEIRSWVLTEGHKGMENQALGLAEAMGLAPEVKRIRVRLPWRYLPPRIWPAPLKAPGRAGDLLAPPWPDLLIACGKRAVAPSIAIRGAGATFTVYVQAPPVALRHFDLVVAPEHDRLAGPNVITTRMAVHRVAPEKLDAAARHFSPGLAHLPRPLVAVLIGGSNRRYRLTPAITERLAERLVALSRSHGAGLVVTPSRRTGAENEAILRRGLADVPAVVWDGSGENPYFGYLGLADAVIVTCDSVSMVSEACATGKPVYIVDLEGRSARIGRFHESLRRAGITRPFTGELEHWSYAPPDDTARAAAEVWSRMGRPRRTGSADSP